MNRREINWALADLAALALSGTTALANGFAENVVQYEPGVGYATHWSTGEGFTDSSAAIGSPSRNTVDPDPQWGGTFAVDPFSAPYLPSQIVSVGEGGSLTVQLGAPATDDPAHPYGIDFQIFGSAAFVITNGDFTGGGITDGSLFGATVGETRVAVSHDGIDFYELNPSLAPIVDALFPTDGAGDFGLPVNPSLEAAAFEGLGLEGIRSLYAGAAGGTGYDLAWAQAADGQPALLSSVEYIRVSVLTGHAEIDGFAVVPEGSPRTLLLIGLAILGRARTVASKQRGEPFPIKSSPRTMHDR